MSFETQRQKQNQLRYEVQVCIRFAIEFGSTSFRRRRFAAVGYVGYETWQLIKNAVATLNNGNISEMAKVLFFLVI